MPDDVLLFLCTEISPKDIDAQILYHARCMP